MHSHVNSIHIIIGLHGSTSYFQVFQHPAKREKVLRALLVLQLPGFQGYFSLFVTLTYAGDSTVHTLAYEFYNLSISPYLMNLFLERFLYF